MKINIKIKKRQVYGTVKGTGMVIYKGGYYTFEDGDSNSVYRVAGLDSEGIVLIERITGGMSGYERPDHKYWETRWRDSTAEEIKRFIEYENQHKGKAKGS